MTRGEYTDYLSTFAIPLWERAHILPSVAIAQAIQESGWPSDIYGERGITELASKGKNYHGLKWFANDPVTSKYKKIDIKTFEIYDGFKYDIVDAFCAFDDIQESFNCLSDWYSTTGTIRGGRYKDIPGCKDFKKIARILTGTYATDPNYGDKLVSIYEQYDLSKYDSVADDVTYYIQVGAYSKSVYAKNAIKKLKGLGINTICKYDGLYYRLQAAAYYDKSNAEVALAQIKSIGVAAFITKEIPGKTVDPK